MTVQGQLKAMLKDVAETLGDELRARLVFVGGCTTAHDSRMYEPFPYRPSGRMFLACFGSDWRDR